MSGLTSVSGCRFHFSFEPLASIRGVGMDLAYPFYSLYMCLTELINVCVAGHVGAVNAGGRLVLL